MMQPSRRQSLLAIVALGILPFLLPLFRGEIFAFRDHSDYFVPLRHFTADSLLRGELPMWNPYNGSGERWLANPQTAIFYPPAIAFLLLPFRPAYLAFLALHIVLLGAGSFLLFRRWCSPAAALFGAVAVMLGGPTLSYLDINNNLATFAWLPLLLSIACCDRDRAASPAVAGGLVIALMFLGGEPYIAFLGALIYAAVLLSRRALADLALSTAVAAGLSAVQLLPFLEMLRGSDRTSGLSSELAFAESLSPADWTLIPLSPAASPTGLLPSTQYFIPSLYLGPVTTVGLFITIFSLGRDRRSLPVRALAGFSILFLIFVVIAAGAYVPLLADLIMRSGMNVSRHASRVAPIAALALIAIAVIGLDHMPRASRFTRAAAIVATVALTGFAAFRLLFLWRGIPVAAFAQPLILLAAVAIVVAAPSRVFARRGLAIACCAVVALDLIAGAAPLLRTETFVPTVDPYARIISNDRRFVRIEESHPRRLFAFERRAWFAGYLNLLDRKYDVSTPAPVIPASYLALQDALIGQARLDIADFLSAGYVLTSREIDSPSLPRVARVSGVNVYRNSAARPMITLWRDFVAADSDDEAVDSIVSRRVDVLRLPIISSPPSDLRSRMSADSRVAFDAKVSYEIVMNRVGAHVWTSQPVIVSSNQLDARGWRLTIDGRAEDALRINGLFRGAFVPAGEHDVVWSYRAPYLVAGAAISLSTLFLSIVFVILRTRRNRI